MTSSSDVSVSAAETSRGPSQVRLLLLVLEGYVYLAFVIATFIGTIVLLAWGIASRRPFVALASIFVGVPILLGTASAIRSLFFRIPDPPGVALTPETTPALHRVVHELREQIGAPPVHRIVVGEFFNASAMQLPRFGPLFPRNVLFIGYPLFATLSAVHLRAVIAHELGHMSSAHGRLAASTYRLRLSWQRLSEALWSRGFSPAHALLLFRWYAPRLHRQTTVLSRRQELLADRVVAQIAGAGVAAETLVALGTGDSFMEDTYWRDVRARADHEPAPPPVFTEMNPAIWRRDNEKLEREMSELLAQRTHEDDTHPSLRDRLEAIGEAARFPPVPARSAADELLGPEASAIASALDAGWRERYAARWKKHYESRQAHQRRVAELQAVASPTAEQLFELGQAVEALDGAEQALPHYDAALVAGHAGASLAVGRIRLEREDESGVPLIEHAMEMNPELVAEGCELLARFHEDRGRMVDAHRYTAMAARRGTRDQLATTERNEVTVVDRFVAHGLHDGGLAPIIALLEREASIAQAMLVRKELRYSTGFQFVLAIVPKGPAVPGVADRLQNELTLPAPVRIVLLSRVDGSLRSALESTPGAAIF